MTSIDIPNAGNPQGLTSWNATDEHGNPLAPTNTGTTPTNTAGTADGIGYGWLGSKQRATTNTGVLLMGVRIYNPVTGEFTSTDPVFGGNSTAYTYPQDPINMYDLDGRLGCGWCKKAWN